MYSEEAAKTEMNNISHKQQEIYLMDLLWRLLEQWRGVIAVGIASALAFSVFVTIRDISKKPTNVGENAVVKNEDNDAETYRELSDALLKYVNYAWLKQDNENDIWYNNDLKDAQTITCMYRYSYEGEDTDGYTFAGSYSDLAKDDAFNEVIIKALNEYWKDVNKTNINQLMSIENEQIKDLDGHINGIINIDIILPKDINPDEWQKIVSDAIESFCKEKVLRSDAPPLQIVQVNFGLIDYMKYTQTINDRFEKYMIAQSSFSKAYAALNGNNQRFLDQIIDEAEGSCNIADYMSILNQRIAEEMTDSNEPQNNSFVWKYAILGFAIGGLLYMGAYSTVFIFQGVVRSENELYNAVCINNFGGIYRYQYKKGIASFLRDIRVYNYRTKKGRTIDKTTDDVISKLKYIKKNKLTVLSLGKGSCWTSDIIDEQLNHLNAHGVDVKSLNIEDQIELGKDSMLLDMECVLIVMLGNRTKWNSLCRLISRLQEYDVTIVGSEYIDD